LDSSQQKTIINCIEPETGIRKWKTIIEADLIMEKIAFKNELFLMESSGFIYSVDINNGEQKRLKSFQRSFFKLNKSEFLFQRRDSLFTYNTENGNSGFIKVILDKSNIYPHMNAVYKENLINISEDINKISIISSIPIFKNDTIKKFSFKDSMELDYWFYGIFHIDNKFSGFHNIKTRFIPLILQKKIDDIHSKKQIIIFDLEKWIPVWESKVFEILGINLLAKDIMHKDGRYVIVLNFTIPESNFEPCMLILNGKTGKFQKAFKFFPIADQIPKDLSEQQMFSDKHFYAVSHFGSNWCLSFPELEFVYSTDKEVNIMDAKSTVEKILGPIEVE